MFSRDLSYDHMVDRNGTRQVERQATQGDDGVESHNRTNVDQGKKEAECEAEAERGNRDLESGMDLYQQLVIALPYR